MVMADRFKHLNDYLVSWGRPEKILPALADDYVLDDPSESKLVTRLTIIVWMNRWTETMKAAGGTGRVESADSVEYDHDGILVRWSWWHAIGTEIEGSSLIKVTDQGVAHHRMAFARPRPAWRKTP